MIYIFNVIPMGAPRMTRQDRFMGRDVVNRYRDYGVEIRKQAEKQEFELEPVLRFVFHLPMPASWSMKKKEKMKIKPHQQKPDIDNLVKGFMDAYCYKTGKDDAHVYSVEAVKLWSEDPRIEVMTL